MARVRVATKARARVRAPRAPLRLRALRLRRVPARTFGTWAQRRPGHSPRQSKETDPRQRLDLFLKGLGVRLCGSCRHFTYPSHSPARISAIEELGLEVKAC